MENSDGEMDNALRSWCQEILKPYKNFQNLTKWKFGPPTKFYLDTCPASSLPGCTDKIHLNISCRGVFLNKTVVV